MGRIKIEDHPKIACVIISLKNIIFGPIFFFAAFFLLFWNECQFIKDYNTFKGVSEKAVSVSADQVNKDNEGKLVHVSGRAVTDEILSDEEFGVSVKALKLRRVAEMYQWKEDIHTETRGKPGGGTETVKTYSYSKEWDECLNSPTNPDDLGLHRNPEKMAYSSLIVSARKITLGAFVLPEWLTDHIGRFSGLLLDKENCIRTGRLRYRSHRTEEGFYFGDPVSPKIGDICISFEAVSPTNITVVAQQVNDTFEPYRTSSGDTVSQVKEGIYSADQMFQLQQRQVEKTVMTWITWFRRAVGFLLMRSGVKMLFEFLSLIGYIGGPGVGMAAFLITSALSLITVAAAWIVQHPLFGTLLLIVAMILFIVARSISGKPGTTTYAEISHADSP